MKIRAFIALLLAPVAAGSAMASDYDGSKLLVCTTLEAISCRANTECTKGTAKSLNVPQFFWLDAGAKTVSEQDPDGQIRTSPVSTIIQGSHDLILQGTKDNIAWSGSVSKSSGKFALTASEGLSAVVVFGACASPK